MRVCVIVGVMLALGSAFRDISEGEAEMLFEKLREDEEVELSGSQYQDRLETFMINYMMGEDDDPVNIELMYTEEEIRKQNGAHLIPSLKSELAEELERRGIDAFDFNAPPVFKPLPVQPAISQGNCGNCYLHTFIAALEIAYFKNTGKKIKFSEQEMTDCYFNGCEGGDFRMVAVTMGVLDKLSSKAAYGPYKAEQLTCRSTTTPDSLTGVKVEGYIPVPEKNVAKIEAAVALYGAVMTCMAWVGGTPCEGMRNYKAGTVVDFPEVENGCDHAVVIVGYTPGYWIVRNSHGKSWGENGHFRIAKGKNTCGIEQDMAVIIVSPRSGNKPGEAANGCPADKPTLCKTSHCCTSAPGCKRPNSLIEELLAAKREREVEQVEELEEIEEIEEVEERERKGGRIPGARTKRDEEERRKKNGAISNLGKREEEEERRVRKNGRGMNDNDNPFMQGKLARLLLKRGLISELDAREYFANMEEELKETEEEEVQEVQEVQEEEVEEEVEKEEEVEEEIEEEKEIVEVTERCADKMPQCALFKSRGMDVCGRILQHCLAFCNKCDAAPAPAPDDSGEIQGECITPKIANARVYNAPIMKSGEALKIKCAPGYVLTGGKTECLIQDVFTNDIKDSRLMPECVKIGSSDLVGNGASYIGPANTYKGAGGRVEMECDSWNADILRGIMAVSDTDLNELLLGNHNYCRNPGGIEPVPFCIGSANGIGKLFYCFGHAGCDTCAGAADKYGADYCGLESNTRFCLYTDKNSAARVAAIQGNCAATCCKIAGC